MTSTTASPGGTVPSFRKPSAGGGSSSVAPTRDWDGSSANTGPKGVIKDWQRYKQLETEKR